MLLDLKKVFAESNAVLPISFELDMSDVEFSGVFPLLTPVTANGSVSNKADMVELNLDISYKFEGFCDRCGNSTARNYSVKLNKVLAVSIEGEESDTIITVPDMKLDVDELVFTEVYLSLPSKFLCREDCKGLCASCGKDLNLGECGCNKREIDPRLAKLAELLQ